MIIYIIDDSPHITSRLSDRLKNNPIIDSIHTSIENDHSLKNIVKYKPDVILLDISIKNCNGIKLIYDIKQKLPDIKMIVLSYHLSNQYLKMCKNAGVEYLIDKINEVDVIEHIMQKISTSKLNERV